jgi:hypothetical protein
MDYQRQVVQNLRSGPMLLDDQAGFETRIWMNWLYDDRTECFSVMTDMPAGDYLDLVEPAHSAKGALSGQRDTLKTTTAKRIRDRMVSDIRRGAVLPPVVVGVVVSEEAFATYSTDNHDDDLAKILLPADRAELSIIDGIVPPQERETLDCG